MPQIFKPSEPKRSQREVRYESASKKRRLNDIKTPEPSICVDINRENHPVEAVELVVTSSGPNVQDIYRDHSYCCVAKNDETDRASISGVKDTKPKKVNSVSCQSDITMCDIEALEEQLKRLQAMLSDKSRLKREFFVEDVMKNDDSVKIYTGIPTLGCLNMLVNLIKPEADKLKYWDKNKDKKLKYQTSPVTKPGPKRSLSVLEELVICLVRLRLGLMGRQLADIFSISQAQVSQIFTTWVCFLATLFKDTLVLWPSKEAVKKNLPHSFKKYPNTRIILSK